MAGLRGAILLVQRVQLAKGGRQWIPPLSQGTGVAGYSCAMPQQSSVQRR